MEDQSGDGTCKGAGAQALPTRESFEELMSIVDPGSTIETVRVLSSVSNYTCVIEGSWPDGSPLCLVVKCYVYPWSDPVEAARVEYAAMKLLETTGAPAPRPVYLDESGAVLGIPTTVSTFVQGTPIVAPSDTVAWAKGLATSLAQVHSASRDIADPDFLLAAKPEAWRLRRFDAASIAEVEQSFGGGHWRAIQDLYPSIRKMEPTLLHADYWCGNVLWLNDQVCGVVDWEDAEWGDPASDVAYSRLDMSMLGLEETADVFLAAYEAESGHKVENLGFWEMVAAVGSIPILDTWLPAWQALGDKSSTESSVRENFSRFLERARRRAGV